MVNYNGNALKSYFISLSFCMQFCLVIRDNLCLKLKAMIYFDLFAEKERERDIVNCIEFNMMIKQQAFGSQKDTKYCLNLITSFVNECS